jgi:hypothetical protein
MALQIGIVGSDVIDEFDYSNYMHLWIWALALPYFGGDA